MAVKYIPYFPDTLEGQALLDNFVRTQRILTYKDKNTVYQRIQRGMPLYEVDCQEVVGNNDRHNLLLRGDCVSTCAYLKANGIKIEPCVYRPALCQRGRLCQKGVSPPKS